MEEVNCNLITTLWNALFLFDNKFDVIPFLSIVRCVAHQVYIRLVSSTTCRMRWPANSYHWLIRLIEYWKSTKVLLAALFQTQYPNDKSNRSSHILFCQFDKNLSHCLHFKFLVLSQLNFNHGRKEEGYQAKAIFFQEEDKDNSETKAINIKKEVAACSRREERSY